MTENKLTYIYGLVDPRNNELRYVGKSDDPQYRWAKHIREAKRSTVLHRYAWIRGLLYKGMTPRLILLMQVPYSNWSIVERLLIRSLKESGYDLVHPTTSEQAKKAQITKFKNHIYKSHQNDIARGKKEYKTWRKKVFERDNYTCQDCQDRNHKRRGKTIELHPHHIKPFATYPELRYEISNGITLCKDCHRKHHKHTFIGKTKRKQDRRQLRLPTFE